MTVSWERRVIPQWLRSTDPHIRFVRTSVAHAIEPVSPAVEETFVRELWEFSQTPSVGLAADLLRFGFHPALKDQLVPAAKLILQSRERVPDGLYRLASTIVQGNLQGLSLGGHEGLAKSSKTQIHSIRKWLSEHPRDALTWLDLGRLHAALGNTDSAGRAVSAALSLNPNSRTILRASSRFYLHAHDPDRALRLLERSPRTPDDPWLLAGHIAISSIVGRTSKHAKRARQAVLSGRLSPRDVTELASSLATLDLEAGSNKDAKRLFAIALEDPNENSLAQAEWAGQRLNIEPNLPAEWLENPVSSEANYYRFMLANKFSEALNAAVRWHGDEPFASRPMVAASFIAAITGSYEESAQFAREGLIAEPNNTALLNNLAFAMGATGNLLEAERNLARVMSLEDKEPSGHTLANLGMISYLRDEIDLGDQLYDAAIKTFRRKKDIAEAAVAAAFRAHFARVARVPNANEALVAAKHLAEESRSAIALSIFSMLTKSEVANTAPPPRVIGPRRWHFDRQKNLLTFDPPKPLG